MNWFKMSKPETIKTQRFDDYLKDHPIFMDHHGTLLFALVGPAIKNIMLGKYEKVSLLHLFYPEEYEAAKAGKLPPNAQIVFSDSLPNAPCGFLLPWNKVYGLDAKQILEHECRELADNTQVIKDELFYRNGATREEDYHRVQYKDETSGTWYIKTPLIQRMLELGNTNKMEKLSIVIVPCLDKDGNIKQVPMRIVYLLRAMATLAARMNLDPSDYVETVVGGNRAFVAGVEVVDPPKFMYPSPGGAMKMLTDSDKFSLVKNGLRGLSVVDDETGLGFQGYLVPGAPGLLQLHIDEYFLPYIGSVLAYGPTVERWKEISFLQSYVWRNGAEEKSHCREVLQPILANIQSKIDKQVNPIL